MWSGLRRRRAWVRGMIGAVCVGAMSVGAMSVGAMSVGVMSATAPAQTVS